MAAERLGVPHVHVGIFLAMGSVLEWEPLVDPLDAPARAGRPAPRPPARAHLGRALPHAHPALRSRPRRTAAPPARAATASRPRRRGRCPTGGTASENPLVYVSFGSVAAGAGFYPGLYRAAVDALAGLPVRVLLTVGTEVDPAELGGPRTPCGSSVGPAERGHTARRRHGRPRRIGLDAHGDGGGPAARPRPAVRRPAGQRPAGRGARRGHRVGPVAGGGDVATLAAGTAAERLGDLRAAVETILHAPDHRRAARAVAAEIAALPPVDDVVDLLADLAAGAAIAA